MVDPFILEVAVRSRRTNRIRSGDGGIRRTYCTVDDATSTDPWSSPGYVQLTINGQVITTFDRICTTFREDSHLNGNRRVFAMEAYTKEISQLGTSQHREPATPYDIEFYSTLFQKGTVQFDANGVPYGNEIYQTDHVQFDRNCTEPWLYQFKSPGSHDLPSAVLGSADNVGKITFMFFPSAACIKGAGDD